MSSFASQMVGRFVLASGGGGLSDSLQNNQEDMRLAPQSSPLPGNHSQWADPSGPIPCFIVALTLAGSRLTLSLALSIPILENSLGLTLPPRPCPSKALSTALLEQKCQIPATLYCALVCNELAEELDPRSPRRSAIQSHLGHCLPRTP